MGVIHVQEPGLFTTVQDLGREGFGPLGVSASGAADAIALRLGNRLVGNAEWVAGLEMTLLGGTFVFPEGSIAALTGSDFGATLDGKPVEMWASVEVEAGQTLRLGPTRSGARCYLCVRGGIEVKLFWGSASTHVLSGLGGHEGRALRKGDVLKIGPTGVGGHTGTGKNACPTKGIRRLSARGLQEVGVRKVLRVTPGPQSDRFPEAAQRMFYESRYRVAEESNRMGIRLEGGALPEGAGGKMISEGVSLGAIQVPDGGQPIILFVEQQTTGGYPKIANVISADFHCLGQLRPRDEIRFERVDWETARALLREQEKFLASEELTVEMKRDHLKMDLNCDMGELPEAIADGTQESLMASLTSVNIACGGHAGDEHTMKTTVEQALRWKLAIGAHPGYPDRANFGRLELKLPAKEIAASIFEQVRTLAEVAGRCGAQLAHVKPHGALYNQAVHDRKIAEAIAKGVARWSRDVVLVGLAGSPMLDVFREAGFVVAAEAFADRRYEPDGTLRSRKFEDALIRDPAEAGRQALRIAEGRTVIASDGSEVAVDAQTICIHGDTPGAPEIARVVARTLQQAGVMLSPISLQRK